MPSTKVSEFNAADWTVTVGGVSIPWTGIEVTFEQFHTPAQFAISAPLRDVDVPQALTDKPPEVVIRHKGREFFVGQVDESSAGGGQDDDVESEPEDVINITGRDLSGRLALSKVVEAVPQNLFAHEIVKQYCQSVGLTDMSGIQATGEQVGTFVKNQYSHVTAGLNKHGVIHDLAENADFVFRVIGRKPFFGPQPDPTKTIPLTYQQHFNRYSWRKSHTNADVTVRVLGWNSKRSKISATAGSGSLIVQRVVPGITALGAKALANRLLLQAERGLMSMDIPSLPGDATFNDILFAFDVRGIAPGIDQVFWPSKLHHVITQDDHVIDLSLYNAKRILA